MKILAVVLSAILIFTALQPAFVALGQSQTPTQQTVVVLAQQTQVILPGNPQFNALLSQFIARMGLSGPGLASAFLTGSPGTATSMGNGITFNSLASAEGLNMTLIANGQVQAALLGTLTVPSGATLAGIALPQRVGVAAMAGSLILVLIDLSSGNVLAFLILPSSLILTFVLFPVSVVVQVIVQFLFIPTILFPFFPIFPVFLACPALPNTAPVSVSVGSGATLVTVNNGGNPVFQINEGTLLDPQPSLRIVSFGASLQYTLLSTVNLSFGFIGGSSTGRARLPIGVPFRLLVQGGGKTACLQAAVISFGFSLVISGTVAFN